MLVRPSLRDYRVISAVVGRALVMLAGSGLVPVVWAVVAQEWAPLGTLLLMIGVAATLGAVAIRFGPRTFNVDWSQAMVAVAVIWLIVPTIGAIPFALSGHFADLLDAMFDSVSAFTTTGLSVMSDLDHLASSLNVWRHLMQFVGGLGIVVAALTVFAGAGGITLYLGEGREERFLPSVLSTARFSWTIAGVHLVVLVSGLTAVGWAALGFEPGRAVLHAFTMFLAGFSTGGFAPQSTSMGYYHSFAFELIAMTAMLGGAMSFGLHYALREGRYRSALRNLEVRTYLTSVGASLVLVLVGIATFDQFEDVSSLVRQGVFQLFSAHTTTGWATIPSAELASWAGLSFVGMAVAMAVGGMGSSTAGGVKALRVGMTLKVIVNQIRRGLLPEGAVVSDRYYQGGPRRLTPEVVQPVMTISLLYVALYLLGSAVGLAYGIPLELALFESVSASATIGLSVGVTGPSMPVALQVVYIVQMWAGRLEFMALFSLLGFAYAMVRGE
ncbi:MAG: TrkH family potassium uptake protein [Acidimicrobiia bacterium]